MLQRFVITEFFRKPDEDYDNVKIWYHKTTWKEKRHIVENKDEFLDTFYDEDGRPHRDFFQPAVIHSSGMEKYYVHGNLHRGHFEPAIIHHDGRKEYWVYGQKRFETADLTKNSLFR